MRAVLEGLRDAPELLLGLPESFTGSLVLNLRFEVGSPREACKKGSVVSGAGGWPRVQRARVTMLGLRGPRLARSIAGNARAARAALGPGLRCGQDTASRWGSPCTF